MADESISQQVTGSVPESGPTEVPEQGGEALGQSGPSNPEMEAILDWRNHRDLLLADGLRDLCWKATPFTTADDESITSYVVPAGTLHRLMAQAQAFAADFGVLVAFRATEVER